MSFAFSASRTTTDEPGKRQVLDPETGDARDEAAHVPVSAHGIGKAGVPGEQRRWPDDGPRGSPVGSAGTVFEKARWDDGDGGPTVVGR